MKHIYLDLNKWVLLARGWYSGKGDIYDLVCDLKEKIKSEEIMIVSSLINLNEALKKMDKRIDSEKISKVLNLITSGLKAGGNISDLLEQTSRNMKEKELVEKKAASSILMYTIFIFFAIGIGAPVLFGLSSILVEIIINLTSNLPDISSTQMNIPFAFNEISISVNFVIYFSIVFLIITDLISGLVIGLVNKGEAKQGLKFFIPLVILSISIFFLIRLLLSTVLLKAVSFV